MMPVMPQPVNPPYEKETTSERIQRQGENSGIAYARAAQLSIIHFQTT